MAENIGYPKVTVLMSVYNGEKYIADAINSILNQTFTDFEFLIINDGSTDKSVSIIESCKDARIRLVHNDNNLGLVKSLNKGVGLAKGEYIARMDSDDICIPERLEKQVKFLDENPDVSALATHIRLMNADGEETGYWDADIKTNSWEEIYNTIPKEDCIAHPTVVIRKSVISKYLYRSAQKNVEDWDLWLRMVSDGLKIEKIDEVLLKYRIHFDSVTMNKNTPKTSQRKVNKCKQRFLRYQVSKLKINSFFFKVLYSWVRGLARYWKLYIIPGILKGVKRILTSNPFKVYSDFAKLKDYLNTHTHNLFFFFPYTHVGGAERIHFEIVDCLKDKNPLVFFTGFSDSDAFLPFFEANAKVFDMPDTLNYPIVGKKARRIIAEYINRQTKPATLGSNSTFYLDLLSDLAPSAFCADIKHGFVEVTYQQEIQLLPQVIRLDKRVFIGKKSMDVMLKLYHDNNIPKKISDRLVHILNYTETPESYSPKDFSGPLNVLYVGRISPEKRIDLIFRIAQECDKMKLPVKFQLVGDKSRIGNAGDFPFVQFMGEITKQEELQKIYQQAHIMLVTSDNEGGLPLSGMEAMANGLALITTNVGDASMHITNYQNGFVTSSNDAEKVVAEMVMAIKALLENREMLKSMSENAYEHAKNSFSHDNFCNSYRKLFGF
ncbi:MAG TPA: glycosyltransferase [Bacteroidia bacterium]|jgi:glycosyltransferase involved in cell wall biosynthesis|nr:glycosyltransferase [Bacteroidia bacterium]